MYRIVIATILFAVLPGCARQQQNYTPNWSSLHRHTTPEWLDGMKFGIYCHWGPQSVILETEDKKMGTLEAIENWKGEKFSASEWVDLFEAAGAQFAGPVAWHGSGMLNWDSKITDWNTVEKGPKVDIFESLASEIRKRDMKVLASFHSFTVWGPISKDNPVYLDPAKDNSAYRRTNNGRTGDDYLQGVYERITEAVDTYQPDMVWVDVSFGGTLGGELRGGFLEGKLLDSADNSVPGIKEQYQQRLISHYFNKAAEWGKEVEFIYKSFDIPPGIGLRDIENGNLEGLQYDPWMSDINMAQHHYWPSTWFYNPKNPLKDANLLVDLLVDITSKNGRMLLNVPPKADGSFAQEVKDELQEIGRWLKVNGEAVYGTIPWVFYGEGPTAVTSPGHHGQGKNRGKGIALYTEKDIRFTQKDDILYAICLGWPGEKLSIRTLGHRGKLYPGDIESISLLGTDEKITWEQTADELIVRFPEIPPCKYAYCLKIDRK